MQPRHMLVTAGPTHEAIDAVRYLANRSSGRMGVAIAAAAATAGWDVTLLLGPVDVPPPAGVLVKRFRSTADLAALLDANFPPADVLIMAAAVADYRPVQTGAGKLPRQSAGLRLELEPTPDLVAACATQRRSGQWIVGFALEAPATLETRAVEKLARKGLDAIVANPLGTMGADDVEAVVFTSDGTRHEPPGAPGGIDKGAFAQWLVAWIGQRWTPAEPGLPG